MRLLRKFSLKYILIAAFTAAIFLIVTIETAGQPNATKRFDTPLTKAADTIKPVTKAVPSIVADTIPINAADKIKFPGADSTRPKIDTFSLKLSKDSLEGPVHYYADDSAVVKINSKKILLYGKTKTDYEDVSLTAPQVEIDQQTQLMTAFNKRDSAGMVTEEAKFEQGEQSFTSDTIVYNFKTQKGLTQNTITQSGEMFIHMRKAKKIDNAVTYGLKGEFTTCNLDHPHFAFVASKMKIVNKKLAISGPVHPEFEGVPVPIYLPFGFFPLSQGRHSGLLPPQFATNEQFGLGLEGLGYYHVVNDHWDLKTYGNIYSYGGWSGNINPTYRKRYKYSGSLNFGLQHTKRNFKGDPDFYSNNSYTLYWSHAADTRARPGTSFSASVNASSTTYNENVANNANLNFQNQLGSSITYSKTWVDKPYNLTVSANHSQNNRTRVVNLSLPDIGFTVSTLYPFQKKESVGSKKWYEQLGIAYNGSFRNQISFYDTAFKLRNLVDTLQWGAQHSIPITLSLPPILGGAIVVSPSVSYSQVWIAQKFRRAWNATEKKVDTTITKGFFVDQQTSFGISFNTALFGTYNFGKKSNIIAVRHVVRPSFSINYKPDLSKQFYYTTQIDTTGYKARFSELQGGLYSGYGEGRSGGISFTLDNNLEMKYRSKKDTGAAAIKKLRLVDGYGFSTSYNFLADSMKLSNFQFYFRSNLFNKININANMVMDPYKVDDHGRDRNEYAWQGGKFNPGRISSGSVSFSTSFQSKPRDDKKAQDKKDDIDQNLNDPILMAEKQRLLDYMAQNPAEFVDFNIPWSFSLSYSLNFYEQFKADYSGFDKIFRSNANFNGSFSLTPKWNFSVNGYYDLTTQKLQTFSMAISREMHCWQMSINVSPVGLYRFFNFTISPKSGILRDLRINRTRSFYTGL